MRRVFGSREADVEGEDFENESCEDDYKKNLELSDFNPATKSITEEE